MEKASNEINKLIAEKSVQFLRNRMILNKQILEINWINSRMKLERNLLIFFDDFMSKYNEVEKRIWSIEDCDNPHRKELVQASLELERVYGDFIYLSDEQIDELMGFVKTSIETLGLDEGASSCNETIFLRVVLKRLRDDMKEKLGEARENNEEYKKINNWISYLHLTQTVGFNDTISGILSYGYMDEALRITNHDNQIFCIIGMDGVDKVTEPLDEDILIGNNIYVGTLHKNNEDGELEEIFTVLLQKEVDGRKMMKAIYVDNEYYPLNQTEGNKEYAQPINKINNFFDTKDFSYLVRDVYDRYSFDRTIRAFNKSISMSDEERQQTEKVIQVAVDWWANAICYPEFDNGDKSDAGGILMALAMMNNLSKSQPQDDNLEKFKKYLGDEIRIGLANDPIYYTLKVDYSPDRFLYDAAKKAQLSADFPWKTTMHITNEEVSVRAGYGADKEVLYSVKENKKTMDGEAPRGPKR